MTNLQQEIMKIMKEARYSGKSVTYEDIFNPLFAKKNHSQVQIIEAMNELEEMGYYLANTLTGRLQPTKEVSLTEKGIEYILTH